MVQTRSQTKKQEEEEANNDCIGEECDGHCNADDEEEWVWCCGNKIPKDMEAVGCKDCF